MDNEIETDESAKEFVGYSDEECFDVITVLVISERKN